MALIFAQIRTTLVRSTHMLPLPAQYYYIMNAGFSCVLFCLLLEWMDGHTHTQHTPIDLKFIDIFVKFDCFYLSISLCLSLACVAAAVGKP